MSTASSDLLTDSFGKASAPMLLAILDQSPDCIKILSRDGRLDYMNRNGQCTMEIDDFCAVEGARWSDLWPAEAKELVEYSLTQAREGEAAHFIAECPTAKGTMRSWDVSVRWFEAEDGSEGYISISRDITDAVENQRAAEAIAAEMRHRLGNAYHVVGSLLSSFARGDPENEQFASDMLKRLAALAAAQSIHAETKETLLDEIVPKLVRPYETPDTPILISLLPPVVLDHGELDALAMVLGELCVNSTKHGALRWSGQVSVGASLDAGLLRIVWSESMDRPVAAHSRGGGKGLALMRRVLKARGGDIEIEWHATGLEADISLRHRSPAQS